MNYNVRIDDNFLRADHVDGEVLQHTDLNELENVTKTAINANYEDIQKLQDGTILIGNSEKLNGATLSTFAEEPLQGSDSKVPTSMQTKQYVDAAISNIDLGGYYTKRETDEILEDYPTFTDYADEDTAGVIKLDLRTLATLKESSGYMICSVKTYNQYLNELYATAFIGKGTLENVIAGKDLINKGYVDAGLAEKVDKVSGKQLSTEDYTTEEKSKLSGIEAGAQVNKIETIKVNGTNQGISSKTVNIIVPTKTSDLTNDSGFVDDADLTDYVKNTDYAGSNVAGVLKINSQYLLGVSNDGVLYPLTISYSEYKEGDIDILITKGTLENVIYNSMLVLKSTAPTTSTEGRLGELYINTSDNSIYQLVAKSGNTYTWQQIATKSYVDGLVGDIASAIDLIQGEVI